MRKLLSVVALAGIALSTAYSFAEAAAQSREVTLYKSPGCQCCEGYADYMRQNGFAVTVKPTHELSAMSRAAGIPDNLQGCHLAQVDNYFISGHVPVAIVDQLLTERPDIAGITLPGMPMGSPGMSGSKTGPFTVYEIGGEVYAVE